jgi:hypothetical protein
MSGRTPGAPVTLATGGAERQRRTGAEASGTIDLELGEGLAGVSERTAVRKTSYRASR